jgi:hypothetical protein
VSAVVVALGLRALRGGAVTVGVALEAGTPRVVLSTFLATAAEGDRLAFEPYHVAVEMAQSRAGRPQRGRTPYPADVLAEATSVIVEGRQRQDAMAIAGVDRISVRLRADGYEPRIAALLVNRAGWLTDELRLPHSLSAPEHPPVIEGLAVRDAIRSALGPGGVPVTEMDEKSLPDVASQLIGVTAAALDARLRDLGANAGRPWRKEQKIACLAAWVALVAR